MLDEDLNTLILLDDFGGGGDGQAFSALTINTNNLVVVKFYKNNDSSEKVLIDSINKESECLNKVYGLYTLVTKMASIDCLIMPHFKIADESDWSSKKFEDKVSKACIKFANRGYFHNDLDRCHVAKMKYKNTTEVVFIDLYRVEKIKDNQKKEKADAMFNTLYGNSTPLVHYSSSSSPSSSSSSSSSKRPPKIKVQKKRNTQYFKKTASSKIPPKFRTKLLTFHTPEKDPSFKKTLRPWLSGYTLLIIKFFKSLKLYLDQ
ncbi:hypothetical protein DDB_G0287885 [Dictyostelium discoideum AX4]|uniref:DUF5898 domain-containing protein n=1 Tax=Dictyostelium discoideum TaxID=44689 RepID=Q54JW4_DICDI|nr:hypothetical protein DDB_G0287885 [Dictyostelium discoideum AX4]EAL63589.1 hypothetical protein DDB_G0287885 [Dictyostelium discoideum AX4]|eukprot:XP_637038.1 hypothetical protein DDB_G0287885 [Dictyostelium discoideum AX4]